jgi:hypothetical protein
MLAAGEVQGVVVAVGIGLAIIGLLGRLVYIPEEAPTLGTMLGIGVGIDYALFLVMRHRNLLRGGFPVPDAVGRTAYRMVQEALTNVRKHAPGGPAVLRLAGGPGGGSEKWRALAQSAAALKEVTTKWASTVNTP